MKITHTLGLLTTSALIAVPAYGMIELDAEGNAMTNVDTGNNTKTMQITNLSAEVEGDTTLDTNTTIDMDPEVPVELITNSNTEVGVEAQSGVRVENTQTNTTSQSQGSAKTTFSIMGLGSQENAQIQSAAAVEQSSDANVSVKTSNNSVVVSYKTPVKIMGLFSAKMNKKAVITIDESSSVTVMMQRPWWSFVVSSEVSAQTDTEIESNIKSNITSSNRVDAFVQAVTQASAELRASAQIQANANL